jgi:hypothetical protein
MAGPGQQEQDAQIKEKQQTEVTTQHIYDCTIFELAICAFDIQSGWIDVFERQSEYTRRDIFIRKINPEKFSQKLQDMNTYLDFIPIKRNTERD